MTRSDTSEARMTQDMSRVRLSSATASMTQAVGSPLYMSLEALSGSRSYTRATDIWSFGVLLWEVAAVRRPDLLAQEDQRPDGPMLGQLQQLLDNGKRLHVPAKWPALLKDTLANCWNSVPERRPTMGQLVEALPPLVGMGEQMGSERLSIVAE